MNDKKKSLLLLSCCFFCLPQAVVEIIHFKWTANVEFQNVFADGLFMYVYESWIRTKHLWLCVCVFSLSLSLGGMCMCFWHIVCISMNRELLIYTHIPFKTWRWSLPQCIKGYRSLSTSLSVCWNENSLLQENKQKFSRSSSSSINKKRRETTLYYYYYNVARCLCL